MIEGAFIQFVLWLSFLLIVSFTLERIWSIIFSGRNYQLMVFVGVLVHEFSHALGCLISGAKIEEISFFSSKGSYVKHGKSKLPFVGSFLISFAPIAGGMAFLWFVPGLLGLSIPRLSIASSFFESIMTASKELIIFTIANWESWIFWLFVYFAISVVICIVPSKQDLKNSAISASVIVFILFIMSHFGVINIDPFLLYMTDILVVGVFFGLMALLFSIPVYLIKRLI